MNDIFANERLESLLWQILDEGGPEYRVYVYRLVRGQAITPAIWKGRPFPDLLNYLRDQHGGGEFRILIRRSDRMILSGRIGIAIPLNRLS
jgi:hypothetical protein